MTESADMWQPNWDAISPIYLRRQEPTTDDVSYGLWSPPERDLRLLGPVAGKRVLDLGCGGGHNVVALARQGARATGMDASGAMIAAANALAAETQVDARFQRGDMAQLEELFACAWDLVLSVAALPYVKEPPRVIAASARSLAPGGRLVISVDHPMRNVFFDDEDEELTITPVRPYAHASVMQWTFPESRTRLQTAHRPVSAWCDMMSAAGLRLLRLVEPPAPRDILDATWPEDSALAPLRHIPQVLILVAEKPHAQPDVT